MTNFTERLIRAAQLDPNIYEEVEKDETALGQAAAVVLLSSVAAGVGSFAHYGWAGLLAGTVGAFLGWLIWSLLTFWIGTKILPEPQTESHPGELFRTIGFASAPGIIRVLAIIPGLSWVISFVAGVWMLAAMVIAVRHALDYSSTLRSVGVCLIGWLVLIFVQLLLTGLFGGSGSEI
jgi:hypothetical protein